MFKKIVLFIIILNFTLIYAENINLAVNKQCKADNNLILTKITIKNDTLKIHLEYHNDNQANRKIGAFAPRYKESYYIMDTNNEQEYNLLDIEGLPKWWPKEKYFLKPNEIKKFTLLFPNPENANIINLIEGKGNEDSKQAWNFYDLEIRADTQEYQVIKLLQKESLSNSENQFLNNVSEQKKYIADFIDAYNSNNENQYENFFQAWKNNDSTKIFIDYFLNKEFTEIQAKKNPKQYLNFVEKYCEENCHQSDYAAIRQADVFLKKFYEKKREELKNSNITSYNSFLKDFSSPIYDSEIKKDYNLMAQNEFESVKKAGKEKNYAEFIDKYPYSKYIITAHEFIYNKYKKFNDISLLQNYLDTYPDSPYKDAIKEHIVELQVAQINDGNTSNSTFEPVNVDNLKEGDNVSFIQKYRYQGKVIEIKYTGKILNILSTSVRLKVESGKIISGQTNLSVDDLDYIDQIKSLTVGGIETIVFEDLIK